ncbi:hypothetical protein [Phenylobacterium sp. J367]|uniref:hypothetical protein n=1 Tax=Phenylobacterium sp. J367 TaxID=2898435 RepID=UPI002150BDA4|nr:hypothetical protein [Phenylobacterium sp. J367]MCR5881213.1 hypothetical protein [Phenylobacterium sp. J367]
MRRLPGKTGRALRLATKRPATQQCFCDKLSTIQGEQALPQQTMADRETEIDARSEEAWVIATNPDFPIRARNVNWFLERGGSIKEVRLTESETGEWSVWLRLAGRSGEHRLAMFKSDEPRVYRDVARAIAMCRDDFGYFGPITLSTDRQPDGAAEPRGPASA